MPWGFRLHTGGRTVSCVCVWISNFHFATTVALSIGILRAPLPHDCDPDDDSVPYKDIDL